MLLLIVPRGYYPGGYYPRDIARGFRPDTGLLPPSWKLTVFDWASLILSESAERSRRTQREPLQKTTPVCCCHGGFCLKSTAVASDSRNPLSRHVGGYPKWHRYAQYLIKVGWCCRSRCRPFANVVAYRKRWCSRYDVYDNVFVCTTNDSWFIITPVVQYCFVGESQSVDYQKYHFAVKINQFYGIHACTSMTACRQVQASSTVVSAIKNEAVVWKPTCLRAQLSQCYTKQCI